MGGPEVGLGLHDHHGRDLAHPLHPGGRLHEGLLGHVGLPQHRLVLCCDLRDHLAPDLRVDGRLHQRHLPDHGHGGEGEGRRDSLRGCAVRTRKFRLGAGVFYLFFQTKRGFSCQSTQGASERVLTLRTLLRVEPRKVWSMSCIETIAVVGATRGLSRSDLDLFFQFGPLCSSNPGPLWDSYDSLAYWPNVLVSGTWLHPGP